MSKIKGQVEIPDNPKYGERAQACDTTKGTPCIVCGKLVKDPAGNPKTYWLRIGPASRSHAIPRDTPDQGGAEMGCEPIGNDCLKKNPALKKLAFRMGGK